MPIRPELRWLYPIDWPQLSHLVRFERAGGRCEKCGRPHGMTIRQLADGRWYDEERTCWRDDDGASAEWPDFLDYAKMRYKHIRLSTAHLNHDPANSHPRNLSALCQRCHLSHDRKEHARRRRITLNLRKALGDLFLGEYRHW